MKAYRIRSRILAAVGLALAALILASVLCVSGLQRRGMRRRSEARVSEARELLRSKRDSEALLCSALLDRLERHSALRQAWRDRDRHALLAHAGPVFDAMRSEHRVTHLYFIDPDGTCFLRVHNPPRRGDLIRRHTFERARREGKTIHGVELGPLGTFTLRVVRPCQDGGDVAGYIEIGEEIDHLTPEIREILGAEFVFLINKKHLDRASWEEGMRMLKRPADWDRFSDHVVADSTIGHVPPTIADETERHERGDEKFLFTASLDGRIYLGGFAPLIDAGGAAVGDMVVLTDTTDAVAETYRSLAVLTVFSVAVGAALFGFLAVRIGRAESGLIESHRALSAEIEERRLAQAEREKSIEELQTALAEIKTLRGIVPICMHCKKVRDDRGYWNQVEIFVRDRSEAEFSHSLCPECFEQERVRLRGKGAD